MAYTAGAAQVSVTPDFRNFHKKIGAQLDKEDAAFAKAGDRWGKLSADGFKARFKAGTEDLRAKIRTDADTTAANREIDRAARNRKSKISVDVSWLKSPLALGAIGAAALGPQVLGLGLAGAGLGAAFGAAATASVAFGAVAKGAISKVTDAQKKLTAAQAQYAKATTKAGRASALKAEAAATAGLTSSERKLSTELTGLKSAWGSVQKAQEPVVTGALLPWFASARTALRFMSPLVIDSADSIRLLGTETNRALKNPFWDKFAATVGISATGAITQFGRAAGHVFSGLAHLFVTFAPDINKLPPLVDRAARAFDRWASSVTRGGLDAFFAKTFSHGNVATLKGDLSALGKTLGNIATATAQISPAAFLGLSKVLEILSKLSPGQIEALGLLYGVSKTAGGLGNLAGLGGGILGTLGGKAPKGGGGDVGGLGAAAKNAAYQVKGLGIVAAGVAAAWGISQGSKFLAKPGTAEGTAKRAIDATPQPVFSKGISGFPAFGAIAGPKIWSQAYQGFQRDFAGKITSWFAVSLPHFFSSSGTWLVPAGRSIAGGLAAGWNASASGVNAAFARAKGWVTGQFGASVSWLRGSGNAIATGLGRGWNAAGGALTAAFRNARSWAGRGVSGAVGWLRGAGNSIATGLGRGWNAAGGALTGAFRNARSWAGRGVSGAGSWLRGAGNSLAAGFGHGWSAAGGAVSRAVGAARGWVTGAVRGAGGWLVGAGAAVMGGFLSGLESGFARVRSFVGGIAGWVAAHKGPLEYDRRLLVPHGRATMAGYGSGLAAGFASVQRDVAGMAPRLAAQLNVPSVSLPQVPRIRGGDGLALNVTYTGPSNGAIAAIVKDLRYEIQGKSGGDVQKHLGQGRVRTA